MEDHVEQETAFEQSARDAHPTTSRAVDAAPRLIDLSHTIEAGMVTYRGLPAPFICDYLSREASRSGTRRARSSTSAGSTWWRIPARTWTARSIGTPTGRTCPSWTWR